MVHMTEQVVNGVCPGEGAILEYNGKHYRLLAAPVVQFSCFTDRVDTYFFAPAYCNEDSEEYALEWLIDRTDDEWFMKDDDDLCNWAEPDAVSKHRAAVPCYNLADDYPYGEDDIYFETGVGADE